MTFDIKTNVSRVIKLLDCKNPFELKKITLNRWSKKLQINLPDFMNNLDELENTIQASPKKLKNYNKVLRSLRNAYGINKKSTREIKEETRKIIWKGKRIDSVYTKKTIKITEYVIDESENNDEDKKNSETIKDVIAWINKILAILSSLSTLINIYEIRRKLIQSVYLRILLITRE